MTGKGNQVCPLVEFGTYGAACSRGHIVVITTWEMAEPPERQPRLQQSTSRTRTEQS